MAVMGARRIFFPGVGKLGVLGQKSPSGIQGWSTVGVWGFVRSRSRRQVVKIMHK